MDLRINFKGLKKKNKKKIALNFINFFSKNSTEFKLYVKSILNLLNKLKENYDISLISFDSNDNFFISKYTNTPVFFSKNLEDVLKFLADVDVVIAQRYHLIILSLLMKKKIVPFIYHHKSHELIKFFNLESYSLHIGDGSQWKKNVPSTSDVLFKLNSIENLQNFENLINTKLHNIKKISSQLINSLEYIR
jgi:polysaccharide pyruvyl transferase WcaK-like protein